MIIKNIYCNTVLDSGYSPWGSALELAGLVILCILIILASYYVTKFIGGKQVRRQKNSNFQLLDVYSLGNNRALQIIKVGTKFIVLAISKDSVTMITELTEDEIEYHRDIAGTETGFKEIFSSIINRKNSEQDIENKKEIDNEYSEIEKK